MVHEICLDDRACERLSMRLLQIVIALCLVFQFSAVRADIIVLDDIERGEFISTGSNFDGTDFMVVGENAQFGISEYRSFLTFDLTGITGNIVSVQLDLQVDNYNETNGMNVSFYDFVLGNDAALGSSLVSIPVFQDLGSGNRYGQATINTPIGQTFSVMLNQFAIDDVDAKRGSLFTIGIAADQLQGFGNANIRFDRDPSVRINRLIIVTAIPEPSSMGLLGAGFSILACYRRKSRR